MRVVQPSKGMTLTEFLVVVAIIALLTATAFHEGGDAFENIRDLLD